LNFSSFSGGKVNIVGATGKLKFEIPQGFSKALGKQKKKILGKTRIFTQIGV